jgi:hypothetical protein
LDIIYELSEVTYPWGGTDGVGVASGSAAAWTVLDDAAGSDCVAELEKQDTTYNKQTNGVNGKICNAHMIF